MSLTRALAEHLQRIQLEALTPREWDAVRVLLLDHLAVVANGSRTDSAAAMRSFVQDIASPASPSLPVIGTTTSVPAIAAAMANAVAGHSIEFDDVHNAASLHPGVVVFPAALAATTMVGGDESTFVRAVVVGYEAMCRVGRAANPPAHYRRHFHPTGTAGHFGAAAAAASAFGSPTDTLVSALGIAADSAAGSMEFLVDGAWTKRLHPAIAARNGIEAALLAKAGFKGTDDGIGGSRGFLAGYSDDPRPEQVLEGWDDRPREVANTSIKAHACCRYKQGQIDALLEIRARGGVTPETVASVVLGHPTSALDIIWEPVAAKRRPRSDVDAQFSMPYGAAVALLRGRAGTAEYDGSLLDDPQVLHLMDLVECVGDPEIDRSYPSQWKGWARVTTLDGQVHEAHVDDPKGDPTNPLSVEELRSKFEGLTDGIFSPDQQASLVDVVGRMGEPGTFKELQDLLVT
jgi:2-methylcitrate dehydratase PrpD